jgi:hypothetical protein
MFVTILLIEVLIALFVRDKFVRPYVGDVLVAVLICCLCRVCIPNKVTALPIYVFLFATAVELAQYFDIVKLLGMESNKLLSTLLGRTFSIADILCYAVGCLGFYLIEKVVRKYSTL